MKKPIDPLVHGIVDYATVVVFALAPRLCPLEGLAACLAYALAAIHLTLTVVSNFPGGLWRVLPFRIHGWVEAAAGPVILLAPYVLGFDPAGRVFYTVMGIAIILAGRLTDYGAKARAAV